MKYITLRNGVKLPKLGFGTIQQFGGQITDNVSFALNNGYELIDTANRYGNETEVGEGLKRSVLSRNQYLIETKLGPTLYENESAIEDTMKRLGVDYLDIMLLHHPVNNYVNAYHMLEKAYREGKIRAIGVSNFSAEQLEDLIRQTEIVPQLMQVECHPFYPAEKVKAFCDEKNIALQAWFPLGKGNAGLLQKSELLSLAEKYGKSTAQIILRWHVQKGFAFVPGSKTPSHIRENAEIFDFVLSPEDFAIVESLNIHEPFYKQTPEGLQRLAVTKCNFEE